MIGICFFIAGLLVGLCVSPITIAIRVDGLRELAEESAKWRRDIGRWKRG